MQFCKTRKDPGTVSMQEPIESGRDGGTLNVKIDIAPAISHNEKQDTAPKTTRKGKPRHE